MGEISGPDLAGTLQEERPGLRVLLTSGTADASVTKHLAEGTSAFLAKPFRPSAFIDLVHELLSREL
jgi:FixJ family two-component response regulator